MRTICEHGNRPEENRVYESDNIPILEMLIDEGVRADTIILDPPYNTAISYIGYKDSDYSDGWSDFISRRLVLAKKLLAPTGVMFINIDENELVSLLNICYGLFGASNVNILVWPKVDPKFDVNRVEKPIFNVRSAHEYIVLCYNDKESTSFGNTCLGKPLESIVSGFGTTSSAKDEIAELLGDRGCFSTPKPMVLFRELIRVSSKKDSLVLDFFAGSGTTGHAVMDLNREDSGNRRFILVTNDESDICRKVMLPRLIKAIERENYDSGFTFIADNRWCSAVLRRLALPVWHPQREVEDHGSRQPGFEKAMTGRLYSSELHSL